MYSGTLLTNFSGRLIGAHQKIDRVAYRHLCRLIDSVDMFPTKTQILYFEGRNGPDGIKLKSPAKDEPWHYVDPFDKTDNQLVQIIHGHYKELIAQLKEGDTERAAFEAAWLAHALVDGLTPAHHYPYEEKLAELRCGQGKETRDTIMAKLIMPGTCISDRLKNNWKMWGPKGLFLTHGFFEQGIAMAIAPLKFAKAMPTAAEIEHFEQLGIDEWFRQMAREVANLNLYEQYYKKGWTPRLARKIRALLIPKVIKSVTISWYSACQQAGVLETV